jgi:methionyl-tRNA formyltransferase
VRWDEPAVAVDRRIRACTPGPGAWTMLGEARIKLWPLAAPPAQAAADARSDAGPPLAPGELRVQRTSVLAGTATGPVELGDVQPPGKRRMPAADWARGLRQAAAVLT